MWLVAISVPAAQHHGVMYHFPQWSPDGEWILASSTLDGDAELYLISPHGKPLRKLTNNAASDDVARWIDHGKRILFVTDRRGRSEPFVMNSDGSNPQPASPRDDARLTTQNGGMAELREENGVIVLVDRRTGSRKSLTSGTWAEQPSFSPNGRFIVYEQRSTSDPHRVELSNVVVARSDGAEARRDDATGVHIWVMEADGTGQRCLTCTGRHAPRERVERAAARIAC